MQGGFWADLFAKFYFIEMFWRDKNLLQKCSYPLDKFCIFTFVFLPTNNWCTRVLGGAVITSHWYFITPWIPSSSSVICVKINPWAAPAFRSAVLSGKGYPYPVLRNKRSNVRILRKAKTLTFPSRFSRGVYRSSLSGICRHRNNFIIRVGFLTRVD